MVSGSVPKHWRWRGEIVSGGPAVVFDIDGVISNAQGRQHFLTPPNRDWKGFFEACDQDELIVETARLLQLLQSDLTIVLLTGRPYSVLEKTVAWFEANNLRWDLLVTRDKGDYGASLAFKRQTIRQLRAKGFELQLAFEDDRRNRDMFEEEGVPCVYIHSGYYE